MILDSVTITGLPLGLHEGKTLNLKPITYLFGANGSGKTLVLRNITQQAKQKMRSNGKDKDGYFAQYITATPTLNFYQDSYPILDRRASDFDLDNEITGQAFYQHLDEFPEIKIKMREALQKYLGRYPNLVRRGINNVMTFLREEEEIPSYSPQSESDGLRRLSLLLTYVYHPKCSFLAIDEPELYLHPDMISFLLEEIHSEIQYEKQFVFATHSPEIIRIGKSDTYGYLYFNLKDKLRDTHIMQASDVGAEQIIEELGHLLDVNRRAFLYAPVTIFVEGIGDEIVYSKLRELGKVEWNRRVFMVNTGGVSNIFNFWLLWRKFDKDCRVLMDSPKQKEETDFEAVINQFCRELSIDPNLNLQNKIAQLIPYNIFIAPFTDVLTFGSKNVELKDFAGAAETLDFSQHIAILQKTVTIDETQSRQTRQEEKEWLSKIAKELFGSLINGTEAEETINTAIAKLDGEHPNLLITKMEGDPKYFVEIKFNVSKRRQLYIKFAKTTTDTEFGIV